MQPIKVSVVVSVNSNDIVMERVEHGTLTKDIPVGDSRTQEESCEATQCSFDASTDSEIDRPESDASSMPKAQSIFLCPLTNEIFHDPVVSSDGETYERLAYMKQPGHDDTEMALLYPNRALKVIMEDAALTPTYSLHANWRRLQCKAKTAVSEYFQDRGTSADDTTSQVSVSFPLSSGFYCPITCNIMHDPVIDVDGNTFERVVVENWIRLHGNSPVTRSKLTIEELRPNHIIRKLLEEERSMPASLIHPEVKKWIKEEAPKASDIEFGGTIAGLSSSLSDEYLLEYRRRTARRQVTYNVAGIILCILLLAFLRVQSQATNR